MLGLGLLSAALSANVVVVLSDPD
ncbi:protein of unknown function [Methylorubrum extorquens]|uniref:Uncharacterized protein n=1 Tax=Methylorubrum extorquens TaxID=408 RepID=A0A2N9AK01_METEX|nr:protein of unknown function [Methylorubrum extorquens]